MPARMTQELQGTEAGQKQVIVRVAFDAADHEAGLVEVAATVRVPAIESDAQNEHAAREMARRALKSALDTLPM